MNKRTRGAVERLLTVLMVVTALASTFGFIEAVVRAAMLSIE